MASYMTRRLGAVLAHRQPWSTSFLRSSLVAPFSSPSIQPAVTGATPTSVNPASADEQPSRQTRVLHNVPKKSAPVELEPGLEAKFAVINIKTKQYKVTKDDIIVSDKVHDIEPGGFLEVDEVHLIGTPEYTLVGRPFVKEAKVMLQVEEQTKDAKVIVFKKKRRKGYKRKEGFRREVTIFRVIDILN